jgi:hypothetical protein
MSRMAAATMASLLIGSRRLRVARVGVRCQGGGGTDSLAEPSVLVARLFRAGWVVIGRRFSLACVESHSAQAREQRTALERGLTRTMINDKTLFD